MKTITQKQMFWINRSLEMMSKKRAVKELTELIETLTKLRDGYNSPNQ